MSQNPNKANTFDEFEEGLKKASLKQRNEIKFESNVRYGESENQLIDIFGVDLLPLDAPILVYIHGGKFSLLSKQVSCHIVGPLVKNSIRPIIAEFDLMPKVSLGEMVKQIWDLAKFVLDYGIRNNVKSVWFCGHSSGANLVANLIEKSFLSTLTEPMKNIFKGVTVIAGIYDLSVLVESNNIGIQITKSDSDKCSPLFQNINSSDLPKKFEVCVAVGGGEFQLMLDNAKKYKEFLENRGVRVTYLEPPGMNHFDVCLNLQHQEYVIMDHLIASLKK